jgi:hypothetical protein
LAAEYSRHRPHISAKAVTNAGDEQDTNAHAGLLLRRARNGNLFAPLTRGQAPPGLLFAPLTRGCPPGTRSRSSGTQSRASPALLFASLTRGCPPGTRSRTSGAQSRASPALLFASLTRGCPPGTRSRSSGAASRPRTRPSLALRVCNGHAGSRVQPPSCPSLTRTAAKRPTLRRHRRRLHKELRAALPAPAPSR